MIAPFAKAAFANGWAEVPEAPLHWTEQMQDAARASYRIAEKHSDEPRILEAVRRTGRKAALYHMLDAKRDALELKYRPQLHKVVGALGRKAAPMIVHRLTAYPIEATQPVTPAQVTATAQAVLTSLYATEEFQIWRELTISALKDGTADGKAAAALWLASAQGQALPSFDIEFTQALDALRTLTGPWDDPSTWMGNQTHGLAYQMGGKLADLIQNGGSYDDMIQAIEDVTGGVSNADLMLNYAISSASTQGSLDLYASEGVELVNVLVSPDACDECEDNEAKNPWARAELEGELPVHPNCRCAVDPIA